MQTVRPFFFHQPMRFFNYFFVSNEQTYKNKIIIIATKHDRRENIIDSNFHTLFFKLNQFKCTVLTKNAMMSLLQQTPKNINQIIII